MKYQKIHFLLIAFSLFMVNYNFAETTFIGVSGSVVEKTVGKTLSNTKITIFHTKSLDTLLTTYSNDLGQFDLSLPVTDEFIVQAEKDNYFRSKKKVKAVDLTRPVILELEPKPGYFFDVTIFDGQRVNANVNLVSNARVEIYNNTTKEEELSIDNSPKAAFNYTFKEGNHYTMLVRKKGYLNHRIELYVDVEGCILCIDGMGIDRPDVTDIMLRENQIGYLLGSVALDTIEIGKTFEIENIYYDYDEDYIRPDAARELDVLVQFLRDNPAINVELSAHTDSRGSDSYNMDLSGRRAQSAVNYIVNTGRVDNAKIEAQGYGETRILNGCVNGVKCAEAAHQDNRRTEITITGYDNEDPLDGASLKQIIEVPDIYEKMIEQRKAERKLIKELKKGA